MISSNNNVKVIDKNIKLFNIHLKKSGERKLIALHKLLKDIINADATFSINYFKEGEVIYCESVIVSNNKCITARKSGTNIFRLAERINSKVIKSLAATSINNRKIKQNEIYEELRTA